jgi:hypothetical protein
MGAGSTAQAARVMPIKAARDIHLKIFMFYLFQRKFLKISEKNTTKNTSHLTL